MKASKTIAFTTSALILGLLAVVISAVTGWPATLVGAITRSSNVSAYTLQVPAPRQLKLARSALMLAFARRDNHPGKEADAEVAKYFASYQALAQSRINELVNELRSLDAHIRRPAPSRLVDTAEHRKASAASLDESGVKDNYFARNNELADLRKDLADLSVRAGFAAAANPGCPPPTINNTLGGTTPDFPSTTGSQTGVITRDGIPSSCADIPLKPRKAKATSTVVAQDVKTCPGLEDQTGQRTFDKYQLLNNACGSVCVTVTLDVGQATKPRSADTVSAQAANDLFIVAYLSSYDPSNPCTNYLADPGASPASGTPVSFSFDVPEQATLLLVVHEVNPAGATGSSYSLSVSGLCRPCQLGCPEDFFAMTDPNLCTATVNYPLPLVCGECGTMTCTPPPGSVFVLGTTAINCTTSGSAETCTFNVIVDDTQPPTLTCPGNIVAKTATSCTPGTSLTINYAAPGVSDNCPGVQPVVCSPPSGSPFPAGTTTVVCTATDAVGNTGSCSFTVAVFNASIQDDSNSRNVVFLNLISGDYQFCCNGVTYTGRGLVTSRGCVYTLQHNAPDRRVLASVDFSVKKGTASIQFPVGVVKCTLTDRDVSNNTQTCP